VLRERAFKYLLLLPAGVVVLATTLYPLGFALVISFRDWQLTSRTGPGPFVGFDNYMFGLTDDIELANALRVSAIFVAFDVAITIVVALALALALRRAGVLQSLVRAVLILPFAMSPALIGISFRFMFNAEHGVIAVALAAVFPALRDVVWLADPVLAMAVLVLSDVWHWAPYMTLVFLGGLAAIPAESEEAARVDGAPEWRVALEVTLPQLKGVIAVVAILKTVFALKMFDQVVTLTGGGPGSATQTLAYLVYTVAFRWYDMGYASAIAWMLTTVLILLAVLYARLLFAKGR
jgi:multiple sugar transport system permease protein